MHEDTWYFQVKRVDKIRKINSINSMKRRLKKSRLGITGILRCKSAPVNVEKQKESFVL